MTRRPVEAFELVVRALALHRGHLARTAVDAAIDQARASLRREPSATVAGPLGWICDVVEGRIDDPGDAAVESAFTTAAGALEAAAGTDCWY